MAFKEFELDGIGTVTVYKRSGTRSLRLSIRHDGSVRVTIPPWMPYVAGVEFARSRSGWIGQHEIGPQALLQEGQQIGKSHRLKFVTSAGTSRASARVRQIQIVVTHPPSMAVDDAAVQQAAARASIRALKAQAERLLPMRLSDLAAKYGFTYRSVGVKQLKTRWGSCDQDQNIILNLFLMQLPWELIDYVLLHELTHTRIMKHGPDFWLAMDRLEPKTQQLRQAIKAHKPTLS